MRIVVRNENPSDCLKSPSIAATSKKTPIEKEGSKFEMIKNKSPLIPWIFDGFDGIIQNTWRTYRASRVVSIHLIHTACPINQKPKSIWIHGNSTIQNEIKNKNNFQWEVNGFRKRCLHQCQCTPSAISWHCINTCTLLKINRNFILAVKHVY